MKHAITSSRYLALVSLLTAVILIQATPQTNAQRPGGNPADGPLSGNRLFNPYAVQFQSDWTAELPDPVKLIEVGQVMEERRNNLILFIDSKDPKDYHRQMVISHWDGARFIRDTSNEFLGTAQDVLLVGSFRPIVAPPVPAGTPAPKKKPKAGPKAQIITTGGLFNWNGSSFTRLYAAPPNLRLALMLEGAPAKLLINSGDSATLYEANETEASPSPYLLDTTADGYVRLGVGTLPYDGVKDMAPGIRFAQSYWQGRNHWEIGLMRGNSLNLPDNPDATTSDTLVVYVPKVASKDKPFWRLKPQDLEESWRSSPLPGRVLDVRIGDPKNEGTDGILVLTADPKNQSRRLTFFKPNNSKFPR